MLGTNSNRTNTKYRLYTSMTFRDYSESAFYQGLYWFRRGLWSWGSHPQTPGLRINRETKYKRRRTVRVSSLSAARQPWCTHTSGTWRRLCEKPCRVSFAPVDVLWSYWSGKPVGGRTAEGMSNQRLWWEIPQGIGFRTGVRFPSGPFWNILKSPVESASPELPVLVSRFIWPFFFIIHFFLYSLTHSHNYPWTMII